MPSQKLRIKPSGQIEEGRDEASSYLSPHELSVMQHACSTEYLLSSSILKSPRLDQSPDYSTVMCAERPAGDAKSNSKKRTPPSFGCTHAESRTVINPSVFDFVRTREAQRNSATTMLVLTTLLRTDVFASSKLCRFVSWVRSSFKIHSIFFRW
jgi:hypothetical protein